MKYARIEDGIVAEVIDAGATPIEQMFTPELVATMVSDPAEEAVEGGTWDGQAFGPIPASVITRRMVSDFAEALISQGTLIGGVQFRCDDKSMARIHGMARKAQRKEEASEAVNFPFKTAAGIDVTITSAAQAWGIFDAASDYVAAVIEASASLQDTLPADFADASYWP